jgi:hypothetical protein
MITIKVNGSISLSQIRKKKVSGAAIFITKQGSFCFGTYQNDKKEGEWVYEGLDNNK